MIPRILALAVAALSFCAVHAQTITVYSSGTIERGASRQLSAYVPLSPNTVTWSVNGVPGGDSTVGTVSNTGLYKAPAVIPANNVVTVAATSTANPEKAGTVALTIMQPQVWVWGTYPSSVPAGSFSLSVVMLRLDPAFTRLRTDPRFEVLLARAETPIAVGNIGSSPETARAAGAAT